MPQPGLPGKEFACHLQAIVCHLAREVDQATGGFSAPKTPRKTLKLPGSRGGADCSETAQLSQRRVLVTLRAPGSWNCFPKASPAGC